MENEIIKLALSQGLWAVLFVSLLFYVLKTNEKRETQYQNIIEKLSSTISGEILNIKGKIDELVDKFK